MKLPRLFSTISLVPKEYYSTTDFCFKMEQNPPNPAWGGRSRMKLLFITRKYPPSKGGMETLSYNVTTRYQGEKKIIALKKKNQMHLVWFLPYCFIYLLFNFRKFDLVHLSDMVLIFLGFWTKLLNKKIRVAINVHGLDINFSERKSFLAKIYRFYLKLFGKEKNYDLLICNSQNTEKICQKYHFAKTIVIPIGIAILSKNNGYTKEDLFNLIGNQFLGRKCLLTVGRLVKRKGVNWFIENVMPLLSQEIIYLVVGEPDWIKRGENELELIKRVINEKNLSQRVLILGRISDENLEILYQTVDLYLMPNIPVKGDAEGFGIVAIEAAGRGLPVVASNLEGIREAVKDGKNGFLLPPQNAQAFKEKIEELLQKDMIDLRKEVKDFTLKNYSWDNLIKKYEFLFENLCQEKR